MLAQQFSDSRAWVYCTHSGTSTLVSQNAGVIDLHHSQAKLRPQDPWTQCLPAHERTDPSPLLLPAFSTHHSQPAAISYDDKQDARDHKAAIALHGALVASRGLKQGDLLGVRAGIVSRGIPALKLPTLLVQVTTPSPFTLLGVFVFGFVPCTRSLQTPPLSAAPTLAVLLFSCPLVISCFLIKAYGEVRVDIRESSHLCTGKFTRAYGEVHRLWRVFSWSVEDICTGKCTLASRYAAHLPAGMDQLWRSVRGSAYFGSEPWRESGLWETASVRGSSPS